MTQETSIIIGREMSGTGYGTTECDYCSKVVMPNEKVYACVCSKYGSSHEGAYCSPDCMDNAHPEDWPPVGYDDPTD